MQYSKLAVGDEYAYRAYASSTVHHVRLVDLAASGATSHPAEIDLLDRPDLKRRSVKPSQLICRWEDLGAWRAKQAEQQQAKSTEIAEEQRQLQVMGDEITRRLTAMGFKKNSTAGFRRKTVGRGGKRHPQFVVTWEILWQLMGPEQQADTSALNDLFGGE